MSDSREAAIRRVHKLLNLAEDDAATQGEVENAMAAASRLILEHDIEEAEQHAREGTAPPKAEMGRSTAYGGGSKMAHWESTLADAICYLFGTIKLYYTSKQQARDAHGLLKRDDSGNPIRRVAYTFYGLDADAKEATVLFDEVRLTIATMAHALYNGVYRGAGREYADGFATALFNQQMELRRAARAEERTAVTTALARRTSIQTQARKWLKEECGVRLGSGSGGSGGSYDGDARSKGESAGRSSGLSRRGKLPGGSKKLT